MRTESEAVRIGWTVAALLLVATLATVRWAIIHLPPHILEDAHRG
jgi:hypothetical protein